MMCTNEVLLRLLLLLILPLLLQLLLLLLPQLPLRLGGESIATLNREIVFRVRVCVACVRVWVRA